MNIEKENGDSYFTIDEFCKVFHIEKMVFDMLGTMDEIPVIFGDNGVCRTFVDHESIPTFEEDSALRIYAHDANQWALTLTFSIAYWIKSISSDQRASKEYQPAPPIPEGVLANTWALADFFRSPWHTESE